MGKLKKILAVMLSLIIMAGTVNISFEGLSCIFAVKATGAYTGTLKENSDGSFRILQFSDIQDNSYLSAKAFATIRLAVRRYNPNLIVLTGDNILQCNGDDVFRTTVDCFVNEFKDANGNAIPFAVTFGNHDYEVNYHDAQKTQNISLKEQYEYYLSKGALELKQNGLDTSGVASASSDNSATLWGTGYIDIFTNDGSDVARRVILLNTGSYDNDVIYRNKFARVGYNVETGREESYANVVSAVNSWTDAVNGAGEKIKCTVFQHIALQEVYLGDSPENSILTKPTVSGSITHACYSQINNNTITVDPQSSGRRQYVVSTTNPTLTGTFDEAPKCSYNSTRDLFIALAKDNVNGVFYGHDHGNTVCAETKITYNGVQYTLTQGFGGGIDVYDGNYNGIDPQGSCYVSDKDGDLIKEAFSYTGLLTDDITYPSGNENIKYIKEVALFNGTSFENACEEARKAGYTPVVKAFSETGYYADLNSNTRCSKNFMGNGSHYECIAFKQTTNPNDAVTDLRIFVSTDKTYSRNNQKKSYTLNGKASEYTIVSGCDGNVNYGITSDTTCAFLYYTKNKNAGSPLTDIVVETQRSSSTDICRTTDHRALQIGNFTETFGTNDVSSFSNVRIANFNLGVTRDTVTGDSVYLFLKRYDGCSGCNADVPEGVVTGVTDILDEDTEELVKQNGGYIYGVCQPNGDYDALSDIGFNWVRFDIPCPFTESGYNNGDILYERNAYTEYKERCREYKSRGFKILAVTPYPYDFKNDMNFNPMDDLDRVKDIAVYLYNDLKDLVDMFQITNEMNIDGFRRVSTEYPLTFEQAAEYIGVQLEAVSEEKAKTGDTFPIGYNCGDVTESSLRLNNLMKPYLEYCDYVALDLYTGNQGEASPKDYVDSVKLLNGITNKPIIITEFGFWSEGGKKTAEQKAAILYDNYGYTSEAEAIGDGQNFIDKLPSQFRKTLLQEHPNEQSRWPSIVFSHYSNHFYGETSQYTINSIPHTPAGQGEYFREVMTELKNVSCLAGMIIYCCQDHEVCFNCGHSWCPFETKYGIFNFDGTPKASVPAIKETISALKATDFSGNEEKPVASSKINISVSHKSSGKSLAFAVGEAYEGCNVVTSPKLIPGYICNEAPALHTNVCSDASVTYNTYTPVTYTATKVTDGEITTDSFNIDGSALVLNTPYKDGYDFVGWKVTETAGTSLNKTNFIKGKTYAPGTYSGMYGDVTLVAQWKKLPFTVTFDISNGGTSLSIASKAVNYGEVYGDLATVTPPNGLYFAGWNTKKDGSGTVITAKTICNLTANQVLYACYSDTTCHIAYDNLFIPEKWVSAGGNAFAENNSSAVYNAEENTVLLTNNRVSGEVTTKTNGQYMTIPVTAGITYSFSVEVKATNATKGWANFQLFVFDNTGYTALCNSGEFVNNNSKKVIKSTYTAPAGATKATIRFGNKTNGATLTYKNVKFIEKSAADRLDDYVVYPGRYGTAVKGGVYDNLPEPTRPGCIFDGWYSDSGLTNKIDETDIVSGDIFLYSKWIDINEVTYDNLFSVTEYAASKSPELNEIEGIASIDLNKGSVTVPGNPVSGGNSPYTSWNTDSGYYTIPVTAGTKYYLSFYINSWGGNVFVNFDNGTATDTNMVKHSGKTYIGDTLIGNSAQQYTFYFVAPAGATKIGLRFGASGSLPRTYSNIKLIDEARYYDSAVYDSVFSYVNAGSTYGELQTPTRSGYSFNGWYTENGTRVTALSQSGNTNVKLFSGWTEAFDINYNSIFDFDLWGVGQNKSGATYSTEVNYGTNSYTFITTDAHTGEITSTANGGNTYRMPVIGGHKYKVSADITADKANSESKQYNLLVFQWPETYTDVWGGYLSPLEQRNFTLNSGTTQTCILEFTAEENAKTISLRLSSKSSGAGKGVFSNIRIQDMTSTPYPEACVQINALNTDSLVAQPDRYGYDKNGWYDTIGTDGGVGGTQYMSASSFTGNKSLFAKYTQKIYSVTYNSSIGTPQKVLSLPYGENPSTAYIPESVGSYVFEGWYADEDLRTFAPLTVTEPLTLYAKWGVPEYSITYNLNGGTAAGDNPTSYFVNNDDITLSNPEKPGCTFTGWTGSNGNTPQKTVTIPKGSVGNKSYTANWSVNKYAVTFDEQIDGVKENLFVLPEADDWTKIKGNIYYKYDISTGDIIFKSEENGFIADMTTGTSAMELPIKLESGTYRITYTIDDIEKLFGNKSSACFTLEFYDENGTKTGNCDPSAANFASSNTFSDSRTFNTAVSSVKFGFWCGSEGRQLNELKVKIKIEKGSKSDYTLSGKVITYGENYGTLPVPERTGYFFGGWYLNSACTGTAVTGDTTIAVTDNHRLYAKWTPKAYKVTYDEMFDVDKYYDSIDSKYKTNSFVTKNGSDFTVKSGVMLFGADDSSEYTVDVAGGGEYRLLWKQSYFNADGDKSPAVNILFFDADGNTLPFEQGGFCNEACKDAEQNEYTYCDCVSMPFGAVNVNPCDNEQNVIWFKAPQGAVKASVGFGADYGIGDVTFSEISLKRTETFYYGDGATGVSFNKGASGYAVHVLKAGYSFAGWKINGITELTDSVVMQSFVQGENTVTLGEVSLTSQWEPDIAGEKAFVFDTGTAINFPFSASNLEETDNTDIKPVGIGFGVEEGTKLGFKAYTDLSKLKTENTAGEDISEYFYCEKDADGIITSVKPLRIINGIITVYYCNEYEGKYYYGKAKIIPASSVYYEEEVISFNTDDDVKEADGWRGTDYIWTQVIDSSVSEVVAQAKEKGVYGLDQTDNSSEYSGGSVRYCKVDADHSGKTHASFTFTGTGFELYSAASCETGYFNVKVTKLYNADGTAAENSIERSYAVNTYYGYKYGRLYRDVVNNTNTSDPEKGVPLYYAPDDTKTGFVYAGGGKKAWTTPTWYDASGFVTAVDTGNGKPAYAEGWAAADDVKEKDGLYHFPVIDYDVLDGYGTYEVVITPRYSTYQDIGYDKTAGDNSYKMYVDGIRVTDPLGTTQGQTAPAEYRDVSEYNAHYYNLRNLINGVPSSEKEIYTDSTDEIIKTNAEVFMQRGDHLTFTFDTQNSSATPALVALGTRLAKGTSGKLQVTCGSGNTAKTKTVTYAAGKDANSDTVYVDITDCISCNGTKTNSITITNISDNSTAVISVSKVKWAYNGGEPSNGSVNKKKSGGGYAGGGLYGASSNASDIYGVSSLPYENGKASGEKTFEVNKEAGVSVADGAFLEFSALQPVLTMLTQFFMLTEKILSPVFLFLF